MVVQMNHTCRMAYIKFIKFVVYNLKFQLDVFGLKCYLFCHVCQGETYARSSGTSVGIMFILQSTGKCELVCVVKLFVSGGIYEEIYSRI